MIDAKQDQQKTAHRSEQAVDGCVMPPGVLSETVSKSHIVLFDITARDGESSSGAARPFGTMMGVQSVDRRAERSAGAMQGAGARRFIVDKPRSESIVRTYVF
jgi:hypothetical protein